MNKKALLTIFSAFVLMLMLGSIYAWSLFVPFLKSDFGFSALQTQFIFGSVIGIFSVTMIFVNPYIAKYGIRKILLTSAIIYAIAYLLTLFSDGNFWLVWIGIGLLGGISTGIGYLASVSIPVMWFPEKKGLITGIVSAGFGGGAILHSFFAEKLIAQNFQLLEVIAYPALLYSVLMAVIAFTFFTPETKNLIQPQEVSLKKYLKNRDFIRLFIGILTGTFAGLIVIGNLKPIGMIHISDEIALATGIGILSVANFAGRLFWGWLADHAGAFVLMPFTLLFTGVTVFFISYIELTELTYYLLAFAVGFGYGAHLVLYARETAHRFGVETMGRIYPYVFLGYGLSGIIGPAIGGFLSDVSGNYKAPALFSLLLCAIIATAMVFEYLFLKFRKKRID